MVLGAGVFQVPFIEKAKELGMTTIAVSKYGYEPGVDIADVFYNISTSELEKLIEIGKKENIDAVVFPASDFNARVAGTVNDALGLPGLSSELAERISDKASFRQFQKDNGLGYPSFKVIRDIPDVLKFARSEGFPLIMKPCRASGSKGIKKIDSISELEASLKNRIKNDHYLLEKFIEGKEYGCEVFLVNGKIEFSGLTEKFKNSFFVPYAHVLPSGLELKTEKLIINEIERMVNAFGYKSGPLNLDLLVSDNKVIILDAGPRPGGNGLPEIFSYYSGIDLVKSTLTGNLEKSKSVNEPSICSFIFGSEVGGVIKSVVDPSDIVVKNGGEVRKSILIYKKGDFIYPFTEGSKNAGYLIFSARNKKDSIRILNALKEFKLFILE